MLPRARAAAQAYFGKAGAFYHEVMAYDYQPNDNDQPANWEISYILSSGVRLRPDALEPLYLHA